MIPKIKIEKKAVYFFLEEGNSRVTLKAIGIDGFTWCILRIGENGLTFIDGIGTCSGIPVDSEGKIQVC